MFRRNDPPCIAANWLRRAGIFFLALAIVPRVGASSSATPSAATSAAATATPGAAPIADPNADPATDPGSATGAAAAASETRLLEVYVNGHSIHKIGEFILRRGKLMARADELRALGFRVPLSRASETGDPIALSDLPGVAYSIDQENQVLRVTASDSALVPTVLQLYGREELGSHRTIESGAGVTLNYDLAGTFAGGQNGATGALELRAFSPWGIVSSNWLAFAGAASSASGRNTAVRLDSAYTYGDANALRRYSLGDFITSGLSWTRPVHIEGAQILSDFSTRPDLVTFPLPLINSSAEVPSTVSVLTNGNMVMTRQVDAGPFEVPQLPVISGAGTITMTVTNALGQQVSVTQPFYASSSLLAPGLQTFAVDAGLARRFWGAYSNVYGKMAGSAIYRRGLTRKFTVEGSVEDTPGAAMEGAGGVYQVGNLGVVNFAAAASSGQGTASAQFSAGAQRIGRVFSVGASATIAGRNYRDIAAMNGAAVPRKQLNGNASLFTKRFGSVGVAYAGLDQDNSPNPIPPGSTTAQHSKVFSANYSIQVHHMSIYANEYRDFASTGGNSGLQVGITIPFGRRSSVTVSAASDGTGQVQAEKSAPQVGDWGYDAFVSAGDSFHEFGQVQYKSPVGLFTAGIDQSGGQTTFRLESQGALSFIDRSIFPSNWVYDSFAIVDTNPIPRVHVLQENRDVGSTNSSGRLLVPDMRSFDLNHVGIDPTDIPPDATINVATRAFRPRDLSGVVIKFPIKFSHAALLQLVDEAGVSMPMGSTATLRATGAVAPVGFDGDVYVEDLGPHNELTVEWPNGHRCAVAFDYKPMPGEIPSIGPLRCQEKKP
ncbi:MAG: fimbria/pilus outer membrane usher protein [Terracidiphilus sp.]